MCEMDWFSGFSGPLAIDMLQGICKLFPKQWLNSRINFIGRWEGQYGMYISLPQIVGFKPKRKVYRHAICREIDCLRIRIIHMQ